MTCGIFKVFFILILRTIFYNGGYNPKLGHILNFWSVLSPKVISGWLVEFFMFSFTTPPRTIPYMANKNLEHGHVLKFWVHLGPKVTFGWLVEFLEYFYFLILQTVFRNGR